MNVMTFEEWINYKALVLGGAPAWFEDVAECERRYRSYCEAFEGNCTAANPMDAALAPKPTLPEAHVIHAVSETRAARTPVAKPVVARLWTIAFALLVQIVVVAGPALAGEQDVTVNGRTLAAQDRAALESLVGPLQPGAYWAHDNGDFGREGSETPTANLHALVRTRVKAVLLQWQRRQQQALRNALMMQMMQNAMRQRQAQGGYTYGNRFSSGQRYGNGSWSHYNGYSNYGVGGTGDGCIYTPNWSNC
jgi:hypothetical protein